MAWLKEQSGKILGMPSAVLSGWRWVAAVAVIAAIAWFALRGVPDGRLHLYFLDVGQGDAILLRAPDGRQILIDGGPSPARLLSELGDLLPFWDRSLDLVILSHPDSDHLAGLIPLLGRYRIAQVLDTPQTDAAPEATPWIEGLADAGIARIYALRGMRLPVGDLALTILNPDTDPLTETFSDSNNRSMIVRLDYGQTSALLAGDAGQEAEAEMLKGGLPLRADILKVGHHGSSNGTSASFIAAVSPRVAIIQVGADNTFGHPSPEVLARLAGIEVLRTDQHGRIEAISDGRQWWIRCGY